MSRKTQMLILTLGIIVAGGILALLAANGMRLGCPIYRITGFQCPGCGNTRATLCLLRLDVKGMLQYNMLYPLQILYIARVYIVCVSRYLRGGRFSYHPRADWLDITFLALLVIWAVLRNVIL